MSLVKLKKDVNCFLISLEKKEKSKYTIKNQM